MIAEHGDRPFGDRGESQPYIVAVINCGLAMGHGDYMSGFEDGWMAGN